MSARTYEELLAAQTELAHFNKYHDPNTGQFTSGNGVSSRKAAKEEKKLNSPCIGSQLKKLIIAQLTPSRI